MWRSPNLANIHKMVPAIFKTLKACSGAQGGGKDSGSGSRLDFISGPSHFLPVTWGKSPKLCKPAKWG